MEAIVLADSDPEQASVLVIAMGNERDHDAVESDGRRKMLVVVMMMLLLFAEQRKKRRWQKRKQKMVQM